MPLTPPRPQAHVPKIIPARVWDLGRIRGCHVLCFTLSFSVLEVSKVHGSGCCDVMLAGIRGCCAEALYEGTGCAVLRLLHIFFGISLHPSPKPETETQNPTPKTQNPKAPKPPRAQNPQRP